MARKPTTTWEASSPLREYYLAKFRPAAMKNRNARYLEKYDLAVREFVAFCGGRATLGGVSAELLAGYVASQQAGVRTEKYRRMLGGCIRSIVRSWNIWGLPTITPLPPPAEGTVRHYYETVYRVEAQVDCKPGTICDSRRFLRKLYNHVGRDILLGEQTDALAAGFFRAQLDQGMKATTINGLRATWFAIWNHAVDRGVVDRPPRVKKLRELRSEPDAWTIPEVKKLLAAALRFHPGMGYQGVPCNLWWHAAFLVVWWTAMRRGSVLSIRRDNVDPENGMITVDAAAMKNRRSKRYLVGPDAIEAIGKIWLPERELLFPLNGCVRTTDKHFDQILESAGIRRSRRKTVNKWHMLRRTTATAVHARAGMAAASALLGHSDSYVTMRYIDPNQSGALGVTRILPALCESTVDTPRLIDGPAAVAG